MRKVVAVVSVTACLVLCSGVAQGDDVGAGGGPTFVPGAPGLGDPYFPLDGNGGYDVGHYLLDVAYEPDTDVLSGVATIRAEATQNLSSFNLDLDGLAVRSVTVDGRRARWSRDGAELTVTPRRGLREDTRFTTVVRYDGTPQTLPNNKGFFHTDDGVLVAGEPHSAATWFPVNDHPTDTAAYTFQITAPAGLEVVANGELEQRRTRHGRTTWTWQAKDPMASYLTTMAIGQYEVRTHKDDGIRYWDAVDADLFTPFKPRTGTQFAISGTASPSYKRLARTISVPAEGAELSFWITRDTESNVGLHVRRGAPCGAGRLDHSPGQSRTHHSEHRLLLPVLAGLPPVHRRTTRLTTVTGPARHKGAPASGGRPTARFAVPSSGRLTFPPMPVAMSRSRSATPATSSSRAPVCSSTT